MRWLALAILAACAHTPNLPVRPDPAPPPGATTEVIKARDGTELYAYHWATTDAPKAVVVIMHGLKDYSARYAAFAEQLVQHGYAVYAFDLRGHGHSAGPRVAPAHWLDYVADLDLFLATVEAREPNRAVYLFGHSMGGAIAALTAERHRPVIAGLILSGPALAVDAPPLLVAATVMAGVLLPKTPALDLPNGNFSSDPANKIAMDHDPLISQPPAPARTAAGLVDGIRQIWHGIDQLQMPLLVLHGTRDKLTAPSGSRALVEHAPAHDKTLRIYDGDFHDLLHEPNGKVVEDDIVAWLDGHTAGTPPAAPPLYAGHLDGDPRGWTQAVELTAGLTEHADFTGSLGVEVARPRPIGWHAGFTARLLGDGWSVALRPVGVAVRPGLTAIGISAGAALFTGTHVAASAAAWFERPLGFVHVSALAEWTRRFADSNGPHTAGADLLWTSVSVRLFGDHRYWPYARAGVGPVISGGLAWAGDVRTWLIAAGLQLYGAD